MDEVENPLQRQQIWAGQSITSVGIQIYSLEESKKYMAQRD